jgi:hypothetical protein
VAEPALAVVGVEVAPPDVAGVLEEGDGAVPAGVDVTLPGDGAGMETGAAAGSVARAAARAGTEASSRSRMVGGAGVR